MTAILQHIQFLVMHHDCVVLPRFGALIAHRVAARIEDGLFIPPTRTLAFNPAVNHNDGMLAASVARRERIGYQAAVATVDSTIDEMMRIYDVAGEVNLSRIGRFYRDSQGAMQFQPCADATSVAASSFAGLPAVKLLPAFTAGTEAADDTDSLRMLRITPLRRFGRVAASVAVLLALGAVLSTPVLIDRSSRQFASIGAPSVTIPEPAPVPETTGALFITVPDADCSTSTAGPAAAYRMNSTDRYFLIVSSHATAAEADRYMAKRPTEQLSVLESDGRFRVYAATGTSVAEARTRMDDPAFSAIHPDGWVYRRR